MTTKEIKWTMFVITAVGNFIAMLDSTTVNLALYPMSVDLHVTMEQIQWVMIAYMLVLTVFLPFFGKLGDILPKNKLYATKLLLETKITFPSSRVDFLSDLGYSKIQIWVSIFE